MSREEVEEFIRKYTDENAFIIEELKSDNGTVVIVKFEDPKKAEMFVNSVMNSGSALKVKVIKRSNIESFASSFAPLLKHFGSFF